MPHVPLSVWLPISVVNAAASVPLTAPVEVLEIVGSLQALSSGTFAARVRDDTGNTVGSLSWAGPGVQRVQPISAIVMGQLDFDVTSVGTGAEGCYITVWYNPVATREIPAELEVGLVAYWKLNEASGVRYDSVGTNYLTDNNTVTQVVGKVGDAAMFTAANSESLSIASNADLVTGDIDFTVVCWVKLTTKTTRQPLVLKDDNAGFGREYMLEYENTTDRFRFHTRAEPALPANAFGSPSTGIWYFIVAWHDSVANTQNIQVNNGVVSSQSFTHDGNSGAAALQMGAWIGTFFLNGALDSVGFWKRVLTVDERSTLYNAGAGAEYPF